MRSFIATVATLTAFAVTAAAQQGQTPPNFSGPLDKGGTISFYAKFKNGKPVALKSFAWDGYNCGGDNFTAGASRTIRVVGGKFRTTQPVAGANVPLTLKTRGHFVSKTEVKGAIRVSTCTSGVLHFVARKVKAQGPQG